MYSHLRHSKRVSYRISASDLLRSSSNVKTVESVLLSIPRRGMTVSAKLKKVKKSNFTSPRDDDSNMETEDLMHKVKLKPVDLEYEKPLIDLKRQISEVRRIAAQTGLDFNDQISSLESNYEQALRKLYMNLTPTRQVNLAQHPKTPPVQFVELHGNQAEYEDSRSMNMDNKETPKVEQIEELGMLVHSESDLNEKMIQKLEREIGHEYSEAAETLGLKDKLVILYEEFAETCYSADQVLYDPVLQDKIKKLNDEFNQNLPHAPNYAKLKFMLDMLKEISEARDLCEDLEIEEMLEEMRSVFP